MSPDLADDSLVLRQLSSLVAPPLCAICAYPCDPADPLCAGCRRKLARLRPVRSTLPSGLEVISAGPYEGVAQELIRRLKFSSRLALAEVAAERMVRAWGATRGGWLVPVPAAPARARARGFDDAAMLARLIARECPDARVVECLTRDDGPRQVRRSREERTADPPSVGVKSPTRSLTWILPPIGGANPHGSGNPAADIWLVDDVATTGATLAACAHVLRESGADRVRALTFVRADN